MSRTASKPPTSSYPPTSLAEDQARRKLRESMNQPPRGSNRIGTILSEARDARDVLGIVANKVREGVKAIKRSIAP